jgi:FkbM family methyltransferase
MIEVLSPADWNSLAAYRSRTFMNTALKRLRSRLRGTWVHHAVWTYKNPPAKDQNANYDRQTVRVMFRVLRRNSNCIDIGAHTGDILRHMIDIAPRGRHYAFEPLPHLSQELSERFPQTVVHQAAVADRSGESEFLFVENDPAYSGLQRRIYYREDVEIKKLRVRVVTVDEVIPRDEKIDFIKIDIEGGEFHAIKGAIETIRRCNAVVVFEGGSHSTGQYGVTPDDVFLLVTETLGYELSTMERWLNRRRGYVRDEFSKNWYDGPAYYFIAAPTR